MTNKYLTINLRGTRNNLLITLTNNNQVLHYTSYGKTKLSRNAQKNPQKSYTYTYKLGKLLIEKKKIKYVNIKFKGWSPKIRLAIKGLLNAGLLVATLTNATPLPFNGCRLKKKKRRKNKKKN